MFKPEAREKLGIRNLVDVVVILGWDHLFRWPVPTLHEWEVRQFYYNIEFLENRSFNTSIGDLSFHIDEKVLGTILKVNKERIRSVLDYAPAKSFIVEVGKMPNLSSTSVSKKFLNASTNSTLSL